MIIILIPLLLIAIYPLIVFAGSTRYIRVESRSEGIKTKSIMNYSREEYERLANEINRLNDKIAYLEDCKPQVSTLQAWSIEGYNKRIKEIEQEIIPIQRKLDRYPEYIIISFKIELNKNGLTQEFFNNLLKHHNEEDIKKAMDYLHNKNIREQKAEEEAKIKAKIKKEVDANTAEQLYLDSLNKEI